MRSECVRASGRRHELWHSGHTRRMSNALAMRRKVAQRVKGGGREVGREGQLGMLSKQKEILCHK